MNLQDILKEQSDEDTPNTLAWQSKQNRLRTQMEQGNSVPEWTKRITIVSGEEEKIGQAKIVVGKTTNPNNGKKVNVYSGGIVLASEWE